MKNKYIISKYQINKVETLKPQRIPNRKAYQVGKYSVCLNKKTLLFDICSCQWYNDGKTQHKPCSHILAVMKLLYTEEYNKLKEQSMKNGR